jgi:hypothetical protein
MSSAKSESVPSRTRAQGLAVQSNGQSAELLPRDAAAARGRTEHSRWLAGTDHGNVHQFVHTYRDQFRHAPGLGWFLWDGHRWKRAGGDKALLWAAKEMTEHHPDSEVFQRCRSRVSTAAEIDVIRFGLHRDLRKIRQDFSRATPRSTGARAVASARLMVCRSE